MAAGLPGAGIGGMFYLLSALLMPVRELYRAARGETHLRWGLVWRQSALAVGILLGLSVTGWAVGHVVAAATQGLATTFGVATAVRPAANAVRVSALLLSMGTLAAILVAVQIARLVVRRPRA